MLICVLECGLSFYYNIVQNDITKNGVHLYIKTILLLSMCHLYKPNKLIKNIIDVRKNYQTMTNGSSPCRVLPLSALVNA
jgi:hypothetical protein